MTAFAKARGAWPALAVAAAAAIAGAVGFAEARRGGPRSTAWVTGAFSPRVPADDAAEAEAALSRDAVLREERFFEAVQPGRAFASTRVSQAEIEAGRWSADEVFALGAQLFHLTFTREVGLGARDLPPLVRFHKGRRGGPDAFRCDSCHWRGGPAGAGDAADDAYLDGDGNAQSSALGRNPIALAGAGVVEMLASEMNAELAAERAALRSRARWRGKARGELSAKGVSFGQVTVSADGSVDGRELAGVDTDLVIKPFGWKGNVPTLRDAVEDALLIHHGMESVYLVKTAPRERMGPFGGANPDGDGVSREIEEGQVTALTLFVAMQEIPQVGTPVDANMTVLMAEGRTQFVTLGCAACHVPSLPLASTVFRLPSREAGRDLGLRSGRRRGGAAPREGGRRRSGRARLPLQRSEAARSRAGARRAAAGPGRGRSDVPHAPAVGRGAQSAVPARRAGGDDGGRHPAPRRGGAGGAGRVCRAEGLGEGAGAGVPDVADPGEAAGGAVRAPPCLLLALAACARATPHPPAAACPPNRRADSGACCATWTLPEAGACLSRPWSHTDATGELGARLRGLALGGDGLGVAVWEVPLPGRPSLEIGEELSPGVWASRNPTRALAGADAAPAVAVGSDGAALVTWVHQGGPSGVVASERDADGGWRDPAPGEVRSFAPGGIEPWAAVAPGGEQFLVWCQQTRTGWGVSVAHRASARSAWEAPRGAEDVVSPDILFANQPQIAVDARGDALVAWYQSEGVPLMTYVSERRAPAGTFSRPGARDYLSAFGAPVDSDPVANPKPALGPHGEAAVVWVQENGAGATPVYLATRGADEGWTRPQFLGDSFSRPAGAARNARAAFGPGGELYVVWAQSEAPGNAILAARRGADGRWVNPGRDPVRLSSPQRNAWAPALAAGPEGGVIAVWVEAWSKHDERVAVRRTGGDRPGWEALEWLSGPGRPGTPAVAMGPRDRAIVGWAAEGRVVFASVD